MMTVKTIWELCLFEVRPFGSLWRLQMGIFTFLTERDWSRKSCYGNSTKGVILFRFLMHICGAKFQEHCFNIFCLHSTTNNNTASLLSLFWGSLARTNPNTVEHNKIQFTWLSNLEKQARIKQSPHKSFASANRAGELQHSYCWINQIFGLFVLISTRQSWYQLGWKTSAPTLHLTIR